MSDTTLSLAARLAANLIVDAINLAKPGARLAGKIGDRALNLIGGPAFSEREAHRFLTMGGSERLNKSEAEREVWEPGELALHNDLGATYYTFPMSSAAHQHNTMPNWQAPKSSAPVAPKPTDVAGSPGSASAPPLPGVDSGHLNQPAGVGVAPGTGEADLRDLVIDLADELCDAVLDSYDHAPMVGIACPTQLNLPLREEFLEGFDWESAARILLTYFSVTRK